MVNLRRVNFASTGQDNEWNPPSAVSQEENPVTSPDPYSCQTENYRGPRK